MRIEKRNWTTGSGWTASGTAGRASAAQLVLFFGAREALADGGALATLRRNYPVASLVGCSTAGEISGTEVADDTIVATAIQFEHSRVQVVCGPLSDAAESGQVAERLARELSHDGLVHVFVLAEGLKVNGSELVEGLRRGLPAGVAATGGLAGDGARFERTMVCCDGATFEHAVTLVGFYGGRLRVGYGSMGGWDSFGPDRLITRAEGNVLYELDGSSALALYKTYLGPHASDLPSSGLHFPLSLRGHTRDSGEQRVVRTILAVDEAAGSLIFAGDIPQGRFAQLMKANVDRLIDGAHGAASACDGADDRVNPDLAILISCVGRKLVLRQRVEEEVESVRDVLGDCAVLSGFYSYGEIAPFSSSARCELHNQTMTVTTFSER